MSHLTREAAGGFSGKKDSKPLKEWEKRYQPMNVSVAEESSGLNYVEYYHRVKEFGADRKWTDGKINQMLGDRKAFEKAYKMVSHLL